MPYEGWQSERLSEESSAAFYQAATERWAAIDQDKKDRRRLGLIVGACGMLMGIFGMAAGLTVYIKTPSPKPPEWVVMHDRSGVIDRPMAAVDAPRMFNEAVRQRALQTFVTACTSYVAETWALADFHQCMVMATPAEQKRLNEDIGKNGRNYPPTVFGPNGWAKATSFLDFAPRDTVGNGPNKSFHYQVRYERTEVVDGSETHPRYTAQIYFTFRPDLKMTDADRRLNLEGLQVSSFSTTKD